MNQNFVDEPQSPRSGPIRILLADPDESLPALYRVPLGDEGFEVDTANSGIECVARLQERVPDLLVLEPQMPWGGGEGILSLMGDDPRLAAVPVVVLTSCQDPEVLNRVARFPISGYHLKPQSPQRLADKLRAVLHRPRLRFALADQTARLERAILKRTGGRIRNLSVETIDDRVIVRGRSDSHYVKQLALAAIREAFEASVSQSERIELEIDVG